MNHTQAEIDRRLAEADIAATTMALNRVIDQLTRLQRTRDELEADLAEARQRLVKAQS